MQPSDLKGQVAIVGTGMKVVPRSSGERPTILQLQVQAAREAMADANIGRTDVGALLTARAPASYEVAQFNMRVMNELKIAPTYTTMVTNHGAGALGMIQYATMMLVSGTVDYVLCTSGEANALWLDYVATNASREADPQFEVPYGPSTPSIYGQIARRLMHERNWQPDLFAAAAVASRSWAVDHPTSAMGGKGPITVDDVLNSKLIASPLRLLDCAPWYPGAIANAFVLTRADIARDTCSSPIYIDGFGQCSTHEWITERLELQGVNIDAGPPSLTSSGARVAAKQAYAMAQVGPKDIDLAQTTSPFSFLVPLMVEELGLAGSVSADEFIRAGGIDRVGGFPLNTSGGYLSFGQVPQSLYLLIECIEQLRGQSGSRQVEGAKKALLHSHGGPLACHSVLIVSSESS